MQTLLSAPLADYEVAVVWSLPETMLPSYKMSMSGKPVVVEDVHADVDTFVSLLREASSNFETLLVVTWQTQAWRRGGGLLACRQGGPSWVLSLANSYLMESLGLEKSIFVLDSSRWVAAIGPSAFNDDIWYSGKLAYTDGVLELAAADVRAAAERVRNAPRKLLVLDLDNTLWGGIVGDDGLAGLSLGGHDAEGEAFVDFQAEVLALKGRGVLLAVASKNEESTALEAIDAHPEMKIRSSDLSAWRINWGDKAASISEIAADLNLGLNAVTFIDDNPHERARIREALPDVLVPEWPSRPTHYVRALQNLTCFDMVNVTDEDRRRSEMYAAERERISSRELSSSLTDWLANLDIVVTQGVLSSENVLRATQLLNKTNQFNLKTRRMTDSEFLTWSSASNHFVLTATVSDRLGDAGLTGLVSFEIIGARAVVVDLVLSCRVMGRGIEDGLLSMAARVARDVGALTMELTLIPTAKNQPTQAFLDRLHIPEDGPGTYLGSIEHFLLPPDHLTISGLGKHEPIVP